MMKTLLETLNYHPHGLTDKEIEYPEEAIAHFFEYHELHQARTNFQEFYIAWENYHSKNLTRGEKKRNGILPQKFDAVGGSRVGG